MSMTAIDSELGSFVEKLKKDDLDQLLSLLNYSKKTTKKASVDTLRRILRTLAGDKARESFE